MGFRKLNTIGIWMSTVIITDIGSDLDRATIYIPPIKASYHHRFQISTQEYPENITVEFSF